MSRRQRDSGIRIVIISAIPACLFVYIAISLHVYGRTYICMHTSRNHPLTFLQDTLQVIHCTGGRVGRVLKGDRYAP